MHSQHPGVPPDSSAPSQEARRGNRVGLSRSSPTSPVESTRPQPDVGRRSTADDPVADERQPSVAGQLAVRWEHEDGTLIMWLDGSLDEATVTLLDRELDAQAVGLMRLIIDLTGLEFIDSSGLDALVGMHWRASKRGDRLSFRYGQQVAQRPIELTRTVRQRSRWATPAEGVTDEDPYFALALACADVDHPRSGDRPEAA